MEGITFDFIETSPQRVSENVVSIAVVVIIIIVPPHTQEWTTYSSELSRGNKSKAKLSFHCINSQANLSMTNTLRRKAICNPLISALIQ